MADTLGSIGVIISAGLIKQFGKLCPLCTFTATFKSFVRGQLHHRYFNLLNVSVNGNHFKAK